MKNVYRVVGLCVIGCAGSVARAQWAVTILDTSEGTNPDSMVTCGIGSTQAGWGPFPLQGTHASVWSGAPGTQTSLKPPMNGVSFSGIAAMSATAQVGGMLFFTGTGYASRACRWSGTAASFVALDTRSSQSTASSASALDGDRPCGYVAGAGAPAHAAIWAGGSSTSFTDLNPAGSNQSYVWGADSGQQVGEASIGGIRAALWTGTAASFVDLTPADSQGARAWATHSGQQVGEFTLAFTSRPVLWTGTAASSVDLLPTGAASGTARAVHSGTQVGSVVFVNRHAALWQGAAHTFTDLHQYLPPEYQISQARAVWKDANHIYVGGNANTDPTSSVGRAVLWTYTVPPPCPQDFDANGHLQVQDIFAFLNAWFAGDAAADFNHASGVSVQDIFDFLAAWFAGCP